MPFLVYKSYLLSKCKISEQRKNGIQIGSASSGPSFSVPNKCYKYLAKTMCTRIKLIVLQVSKISNLCWHFYSLGRFCNMSVSWRISKCDRSNSWEHGRWKM
jgi:hypothetical protein